MKKLLAKIENTDFRKPVKRLILITLAVVIVFGALTTFLLRTQISELSALKQSEEQSDRYEKDREDHTGEDAHDNDTEDRYEEGTLTPPSTGAVVVAITTMVLCGLCALAYWLMVAAWLYKASAKAGMNRALWTILGLLGNLLALLVFLIVRGRLTRCVSCGTWQKPGQYCVSCGAKLENLCPNCGNVCPVSEDYCPRCGTSQKETKEQEKA